MVHLLYFIFGSYDVFFLQIKSLVLDVILEKEEGTLVIKQKRVRQIIYDWCDHSCEP